MEIRDLLRKLCMPIKQKTNEEDAIKAEESNMTETIINVIYILK
jgi:hypothetical protein